MAMRCRAASSGNAIQASVRPEQVPLSDPLAHVTGSSSVVYFETDIFPGLAITETNPGVETTAYGMLADFITLDRSPQWRKLTPAYLIYGFSGNDVTNVVVGGETVVGK